MGHIYTLSRSDNDLNIEQRTILDFFDAIETGDLVAVEQYLKNPVMRSKLNNCTIADIARDKLAPSVLAQTPFIIALQALSTNKDNFQQRIKVVEALLAAGCDVNQRYTVSDVRSYSSLHVALNWLNLSAAQEQQILNLLLKNNADPNGDAYSFRENSIAISTKPLDCIHQTEDPKAVAVQLVNAGANPNLVSTETKARFPSLFSFLTYLWNSLFCSDTEVNKNELSALEINAENEVTAYLEERRRQQEENEKNPSTLDFGKQRLFQPAPDQNGSNSVVQSTTNRNTPSPI